MLTGTTTSVPRMSMAAGDAATTRTARLDAESQAWLDRLSPQSREREAAIAHLHTLFLKASRLEVNRRRAAFFPPARQRLRRPRTSSADDALVAVLSKLADLRRESRFTTWAYNSPCSRQA